MSESRAMRVLIVLVLASIPAVVQSAAVVQFNNLTRPASKDFQIGDRFEVVIVAAAFQSVSVRTMMEGRTDWGPVIGWTDNTGRWVTTGQFEKGDFGSWSEFWTVGGKLAGPSIQFSVGAPCLKDGRRMAFQSGPNVMLSCDTASGLETFHTPPGDQPFRTPDGRVVPERVRTNQTAEQYHAEIMQSLITGGLDRDSSAGEFGDQAGSVAAKMIGVNALNINEIRNVLRIIRFAWAKNERIPETAKNPSQTLLFLRKQADSNGDEILQREIAETVAYVQAR
jgi:hypothetical protein